MQKAFEEVRNMLSGEQSGHGFDHVERVYRLALELAEKEGADKEIAGLAALLHDCDDYKLAGEEAAEKLPNARRILTIAGANLPSQWLSAGLFWIEERLADFFC